MQRTTARRTTARRIAFMAATILTTTAAPVWAAQYTGWADTGWGWLSKRECCHAAIELAHEDAIMRCLDAGGRPRSFSGGRVRGSCQAEWMQEPSGQVIYRCRSQSSVACR